MENKKITEDMKLNEYSTFLEYVRNYALENNISIEEARKISLQSDLVRRYAGYGEDSTEENYNDLFRNYYDKQIFDEHNAKVLKARKEDDKEELRRLSQAVSEMARYNKYAKSFVDRKLFERQFKKLFSATDVGNVEKARDVYGNIVDMTAEQSGEVNQYAQSYVDNGLDRLARTRLEINKKVQEQDALAI